MAEEDLVGVEGEDLRLRESALDLDGEQGLLNFALEGAVGRQEEITGQLHGQRRGALYAAAGFDVAIGSSHNAPDVDAPVPVEIFVLDGDQGIAQDLRVVVVGSDHAALQREGANDAALGRRRVR